MNISYRLLLAWTCLFHRSPILVYGGNLQSIPFSRVSFIVLVGQLMHVTATLMALRLPEIQTCHNVLSF